jgi:hypothetical protein
VHRQRRDPPWQRHDSILPDRSGSTEISVIIAAS